MGPTSKGFRRLGDPLFSLGLERRRELGDRRVVGASGVQYETPAYTNAGGTGNRTASITVTTTLIVGAGAISAIIQGSRTENTFYWNTQAVSGKYIKFNFVTRRLITEAKFYQRDGFPVQGTWKWQGSDDDSVWVDISSNFTLGGDNTLYQPSVYVQTLTQLSGNTTGYIYYRLLGVSGNSSDASYICEMEFKIGNII